MNVNNSVFLKYENKWIVADKNYKKVYAAEDDLDELQKDIKRLKIEGGVVAFIPPFDSTLSPKCQY